METKDDIRIDPAPAGLVVAGPPTGAPETAALNAEPTVGATAEASHPAATNSLDRYADYFQTDHLQRDLKRRTLRSGSITLISQAIKFFLQLASMVVLARLLSPRDFGLVAMVTVITGFLANIKDLGLSQATVQRPNITHGQVTNLFWVNVAVSAIIGAIVMATAPLMALWYGQAELMPLTLALGAVSAISGLGVQHQALLQRRMEFKALVVRDVIGQTAGVVAGIVAAKAGMGYWSLVVMTGVGQIVSVALLWVGCPWRPSLPSRGNNVRGMLKFGGYLSASNVVTYFSQNLDSFLIGTLFGPEPLGIYARARNLMLLPLRQVLPPINTVINPALVIMANDPERYRRAFLSILSLVVLATCLAVTIMMATADWIVRIALGPGWEEAGTIFAVLGLFAFVESTASLASLLFTTRGDQSHLLLKWKSVSVPIIVAGILVGLPWGTIGVATTYVASGVLIRSPMLFWYCGKHTPVKLADFFRTITLPIACAVLTVALILAARHELPPIDDVLHRSLSSVGLHLPTHSDHRTHPATQQAATTQTATTQPAHVSLVGAATGFVLASAAGTTIYIALLAALPWSRRSIKDSVGLVRQLRSSKSGKGP